MRKSERKNLRKSEKREKSGKNRFLVNLIENSRLNSAHFKFPDAMAKGFFLLKDGGVDGFYLWVVTVSCIRTAGPAEHRPRLGSGSAGRPVTRRPISGAAEGHEANYYSK